MFHRILRRLIDSLLRNGESKTAAYRGVMNGRIVCVNQEREQRPRDIRHSQAVALQ